MAKSCHFLQDKRVFLRERREFEKAEVQAVVFLIVVLLLSSRIPVNTADLQANSLSPK